MTRISALDVTDVRFPTSLDLDGSDAMNPEPDYSAAYVVLRTDDAPVAGCSLLFTTGRGNDVACAAVQTLAPYVVGRDVGELVADVGALARTLTWDGQLRWLGPEKGVMHMAIGAVVNAAWDLRARLDGQPLWRVLASLPPEEIVRQIDFTYIDDALTRSDALAILEASAGGRAARTVALETDGLPAYTTSAGWMGYDDAKVARLVRQSVAEGFTMLKLKVGGDIESDTRRLQIARVAAGEGAHIALDANQRWGVDQAIDWMGRLAEFEPYWIEERHRRARPEPGDLQATATGRGDRCRADRRLPGRRAQREPRHPPAGRQVRRAGLPARRWRGSVRDGPAPGHVRLRRGQR
jgi:L-fuconate dehydratase